MTRILLALLGSTAVALPAFAADIVDYPPPEPPVVLAPAFSWTGLYVGGQAGGSFNSGSPNAPGSFVFVPGIPATPARDAVAPTPEIPGTPGSPGTPGTPGTPFIPGTPGQSTTYSFACGAGVTPATASTACAVSAGNVGVPISGPIAAELAAAVARSPQTGSGAIAGEFIVGTPGTPDQPATPGTPGTPPTEGTPTIPATPGSPAMAAQPGTPDRTYAYDFGANHRAYSEDDDSFAGGGHVGYNVALGASSFVVGVVGDLSYVDITKSAGITNGIDTIGVARELDYLATVRLKAGVGLDRFLVYGTGGVAFGNIETTIVNTPFGLASSNDDTRVGYAVGAGTDYAVTDNLILGLEYLYTDLGSTDAELVVPLGNGSTLTTKSDDDFDFHTVWAKASFRFD